MTFEQIIFYWFAAVLTASAVTVITVRNPVHAALFLVLCFFTSAGLWLLLEAEFLALTLVLVYVGAVMVLFLFVVMMLDINVEQLKQGFVRYLPVGALVAVVVMIELLVVVAGPNFGVERFGPPVKHDADYSNTAELGYTLYTDYVYPFEIAGVILLVAIIAAILLTLRKRPKTRYQNPSEQVQVRKEDRLRIIKMDSEPPTEGR
ncbi:MAG: NADH-quinone oxidoreductase subunit J [Gammaproteobacteria bacterium]|nr:MAG: NADH-quinone oxidoreductase subunit J [Gammaproteobacteria bacterium]